MAASGSGRGGRPALITSARPPKSLDADQRNKRYLITMAFRVVFFIAGCASPQPLNWVFFSLAAVLPPIAVVLANAIDKRSVATQADAQPVAQPALPTGEVIPGSVAD